MAFKLSRGIFMDGTPIKISTIESKLRIVPTSITYIPVLYTNATKLMIGFCEISYHDYRLVHSPS
jgi:hypothetical protein